MIGRQKKIDRRRGRVNIGKGKGRKEKEGRRKEEDEGMEERCKGKGGKWEGNGVYSQIASGNHCFSVADPRRVQGVGHPPF